MFGFVKEALITLLSLDGSVYTKCLSLNNQLCLGRCPLTDVHFYEVLLEIRLTNFLLV